MNRLCKLHPFVYFATPFLYKYQDIHGLNSLLCECVMVCISVVDVVFTVFYLHHCSNYYFSLYQVIVVVHDYTIKLIIMQYQKY